MLDYTVVIAKLGSEFESHEHMGDFDLLSEAKSFAKNILAEDDVAYALVYNIDQELIAEFFDE
jgi:hypothetical protein